MSILLSSSLESFIQLMGALFIFLFVLVIAYLTTRWMGSYERTHMSNKNLKIIEMIRVGNNKTVSIMAAGKKYLVVAVGKDEVNLLATLDPEDLEELPSTEVEKDKVTESFENILAGIRERLPKK